MLMSNVIMGEVGQASLRTSGRLQIGAYGYISFRYTRGYVSAVLKSSFLSSNSHGQ